VIACDPAAPAAVYVSGSSLSRSTDEGASWQPTALPVFGGALLGALALGSGHPATVYASVGSKVYFSGDRGVSWALLGGQSLPYVVFDLAVDPDGSRLYAATQLGLYAWARE
jgi:hypothetical protein